MEIIHRCNNSFADGILMDVDKAFDTVKHQLLLAKLHGYGFSKQASAIIFSHLSNWNQRIKINNVFSSWKDIILGLTQGSVSWTFAFQDFPVWFVIILPKRCRDMYNFADDTATYVSDESLEDVLTSLEKNSMLLYGGLKMIISNWTQIYVIC